MASVGAVMVSQLSKLLEQKAIEQDAQSIERLHPALMEQMRKLQAALQTYYGCESEGQQQVTESSLEQLLLELIQALQSYDYDRSDAIAEKLQACNCSADLKSSLQTLREQEFQLEFEECIKTASQMLDKIHSERE